MSRNPILGLAAEAASAGFRTAQRSLGVAGELVDEVRTNVTEVVRTAGSATSRALDAADVGIGEVRLTRDGAEWARVQLGRGLRQLLALPDDERDRLRGADPSTLARAVLQMLGTDEELLPLPTIEEQVRTRFAALLDPTEIDEDAAPALLAITAQMSPDEARIVRHLSDVGGAPTVSLELTGLTGRDATLLAEHLSVVVERAGGDHPERGPAYVANLLRLGVCRLEDGPDADPDVELVTTAVRYREAAERARRGRGRLRTTVRWLRLSELGTHLVDVALGLPTDEAVPPPLPPAALEGQV